MDSTPAHPKRSSKTKLKNRTWEYPEGSGIKIAEIPNKTGGRVFGVSYQVRIPAELLGQPGKREMHQRKTEEEAKRLAEERLLALRQHGTQFSAIPVQAQKQAAIAWGMLSEHGIDFIDAARAAIRVLRPAGGQRTLAQVLGELRESKAARFAAGELDIRTHDDFKSRSLKIETALGAKLVSEITAKDVIGWLRKLRSGSASTGEKPLSRRSVFNYRNTFSEALKHAKAKRYCAENPMEHITREDYKVLGGMRAERKLDAINILTVEEAERLLRAAVENPDTGLLGSTVLRLFCGLRTAEVCKLDWSEVHWMEARPYVHISERTAKKRRIRHVDIPANALAWLKLCNPPASGKVVPGKGKDKGYSKRFNRLVRLAGLVVKQEDGTEATDWDNNDSRHSYGSYHYALHGDAVRTAGQMGHKQGDDTLFAHYRQLVRKEDAAAYFGLMPPARDASNVTPFPQAAAS